jgi:hypothetical protein
MKYMSSKDIVELELEILAEIDKLIYCSEGIGKRNPLGVWVSLWLLILAYQEHMIYLNYYERTSCYLGIVLSIRM